MMIYGLYQGAVLYIALYSRGVRYAPLLLRDCEVIGSGSEDPPVTMTVKCPEFFIMTVIVTFKGPIF